MSTTCGNTNAAGRSP